MKMSFATAVAVAVCVGLPAAEATVWPQSIGGMEHALVYFDGTDIAVVNEHPDPLAMLNHGELYTPPADVLDGKGYNNQPGFSNGAAFSPPAGTKVWVEVVSITPGLDVYEGGMRSMPHMHTYAPILDDVGDRWMWNQSMHHPWFAATLPGLYAAEYEVYIGDEISGDPVAPYGSDAVTFNLEYVPEPATLGLLAFGGGAVVLRRRRR